MDDIVIGVSALLGVVSPTLLRATEAVRAVLSFTRTGPRRAGNPKSRRTGGEFVELSLARKQLQEIRRLSREGTQKPEWTKPLTFPAILLAMGAVALCLLVNFK